MKEVWYTVAQAAELLQLHEKTVQRFIREGKLTATKVGRSYRISGHDLSVYTGEEIRESPQYTPESSEIRESPLTTAVIDCFIGGKDQAMRISNTINAVMNSKLPEDGQGRFDFMYFEEELKGKIIFHGSPQLVSRLLLIIDQLLKQDNSNE